MDCRWRRRSVRWGSPELITIDLAIAPLNLESCVRKAVAPSINASVCEAAGLQGLLLGKEAESAAAASLCALARGFCAMLPAACAHIQAQVGVFLAAGNVIRIFVELPPLYRI